ncbi:MAG: hypothetical protein Q4F84_01395 [Fibrobacter sp.]|nr:hypothetical protein [Fibrobacter sp.]
MNKTAKFFISLTAGIIITGCNLVNNDSDVSNEPTELPKESNAFLGTWDLTIEGTSNENSAYFGENGECRFLNTNKYSFSNDTIWLINDTNGGVQSPDTIVAKYNFDEYGTLTFERINYQDSFGKQVSFPKLICKRHVSSFYGFQGGISFISSDGRLNFHDFGFYTLFEGEWLILPKKDSVVENVKIVSFESSTTCSFFEANKYKFFNDTILLIHEYNDTTALWIPNPDTVTAKFNFSTYFDTLFLECLNNQGFNGNSKFTLSRIKNL